MNRAVHVGVAAALVAATVAVAIGQGVATRSVHGDNQLYFFMAERAASGHPPHTAQMEVKTQLPTLVSAAAIAAGRRFGADDVLAARAVTVAATAVSAILVWLLALRLTGSAAAGIVAAASLLTLHAVAVETATGFQPKLVMMPFVVGAHLATASRRPFAAGLLAACAFLCWQPAGLVLAACAVATLLDGRGGLRALLRFTGGTALALASYEAWFALSGALREQLHQEWVLAPGSQRKPSAWHESVWFVLTESQTFQTKPNLVLALGAASAVLLWIGAVLRPRRAFASLRERPGDVAFWIAAHLTTAFTLYDHQAHPDMLLVEPYFAVAAGVLSSWLVRWLESRLSARLPRPGAVAAAAAAAFVCWAAIEARNDAKRSGAALRGLEQQRMIAKMAGLYFDHRGSVWALGPLHLLALEHRSNWVPVGNVGRESQELDMKSWRPLKDGRMPEVILTSRGLRPGSSGWIQSEYIDVTPSLLAADRVRVYMRKGPGFERETAPKAFPNPGSGTKAANVARTLVKPASPPAVR